MENTVHLETGTGRVLRLTGEGVCLKASTPAARVAGEELPSPDFRADGESTCDVAGIGGRAVRETAMLDGIELVRETFQSADGAMCAVRLSITNRRSTPFALESITPITAVGDEALTVADAGFADWRVLRMARQKNDIPGCFRPATHDADQNADNLIDLSELLRVIQFFNSDGYHCAVGTEDGYDPGPGDTSCTPHASDYNSEDWAVNLSELLRVIQFFNSAGYHECPSDGTEDGYCVGPP